MYWNSLKQSFRALDMRLTSNAYEHGCHLVRDMNEPTARRERGRDKIAVKPSRTVAVAR